MCPNFKTKTLSLKIYRARKKLHLPLNKFPLETYMAQFLTNHDIFHIISTYKFQKIPKRPLKATILETKKNFLSNSTISLLDSNLRRFYLYDNINI